MSIGKCEVNNLLALGFQHLCCIYKYCILLQTNQTTCLNLKVGRRSACLIASVLSLASWILLSTVHSGHLLNTCFLFCLLAFFIGLLRNAFVVVVFLAPPDALEVMFVTD